MSLPKLRRQQKQLTSDLVNFGLGNNSSIKFFELGTGGGKTACYLHAALEVAEATGEKVIIATPTNMLVHQTLAEVEKFGLPKDSFAPLLGMTNFISPESFESAINRNYLPEEALEWFDSTENGMVSDLEIFLRDIGVAIPPNLEHLVGVNPMRSRGDDVLMESERAYYLDMLEQLEDMPVIITNHSMLLLPQIIKWNGLPEHRFLIIDEGHAFPDAARRFLTYSFSPSRTLGALRVIKGMMGSKLPPSSVKKPLALLEKLTKRFTGKKPLDAIRPENEEHIAFSAIHKSGKKLITELEGDDKSLCRDTPQCLNAYLRFKQEMWELGSLSKLLDSKMVVGRQISEKRGLPSWSGQKDEVMYWLNHRFWPNMPSQVALASGTVNMFRPGKRDHYNSAICTSLGLFKELRTERMGMRDWVKSYQGKRKKIEVYACPETFPSPKTDEWISTVGRYVADLYAEPQGKTLVLVGSYRDAQALADTIVEAGIAPTNVLCATRKESAKSKVLQFQDGILIGTKQFWTGVDIDGIDHLIVGRLPYSPPNTPRWEALRRFNPSFANQLYVWETILLFRQGCGRLIRDDDHSGTIHILDSRIYNKRFGLEKQNWIDWASGQLSR